MLQFFSSRMVIDDAVPSISGHDVIHQSLCMGVHIELDFIAFIFNLIS